MVHCKIHLENNDRGVYYAGQMLKGIMKHEAYATILLI